MAGSKTRYLEQKLQDHVYGATVYTPPTTLYLGLLTDSNTKVQRDNQIFTEVASAGGYIRLAITNNTTNFPAAAEGTIVINGVSTICSVKLNGTVFTWATATGSWGEVTAVGIFDGASGTAKLLEWFDLDTAQNVASGGIMSLPASTGMALGLD